MLGTAMLLLRSSFLLTLHLTGGISSFPKPLTAAEERMYLERYAAGDLEARNILIERNLRLVAHIIKKYYTQSGEQEDLISIGTIGLIKGISSYKQEKGVRLATYAARCVENEILMLLRSSRKFSKEVSLFEPIGVDRDGETVSLVDILETENPETLDTMIFKQDVKEMYEAIEACLSDTEKKVLGLRYGLYRGKEHTQREIASVMGISRSYVSRIEKRAIEKVRAELGRV